MTGLRRSMWVRCLPKSNVLLNITLVMFGLWHILDRLATMISGLFQSLLLSLILQLHHWVGGPPNMYDVSGSAHFINKCDNGIVIHRNRDPAAGPVDQVQVSILFVFVTVITQGNTFVNLSCNCRFVFGRFGIRLLEP